MKKVVVFGTFDFAHPGHIFFLNEAKKHGDFLVVIIARDTIVQRYKNRLPFYNEMQRIEAVKSLHLADEIILGDKQEGVFSYFQENEPYTVCLGHDQLALKEVLLASQFNITTHILPSYNRGEFRSSLYYDKHKQSHQNSES